MGGFHKDRRGDARVRASARVVAAALLAVLCQPACANVLVDSTFFLGLKQGTRLSQEVERMGRGGYELDKGAFVDFQRFYRQWWIDTRFDFMTQLNEGVGVLWGVSTGESGPKYRIAPGFKLGMIFQYKPTPASTLSFSFSGILGGRLREKTCRALYGEEADWVTVNCRLAASPLPPSDTLKYVVNMKPPEWGWLGLRYEARF